MTMARKMVILPYDMAKHILEPITGHSAFDLKDGADMETKNRLNQALNWQDGEDDDDKPKKQTLTAEPVAPETPVTPATPVVRKRKPRTPPSRPTKAMVRLKLSKTGAFNGHDREVITWTGKAVNGSNIDEILTHCFADNSAAHPTGTREIAQRLKALGITDIPNRSVRRLITGAGPIVETPRVTRSKWRKF